MEEKPTGSYNTGWAGLLNRKRSKKKENNREKSGKESLFSVLPTIPPAVKFKRYWNLVHVTATAVFKEETLEVNRSW